MSSSNHSSSMRLRSTPISIHRDVESGGGASSLLTTTSGGSNNNNSTKRQIVIIDSDDDDDDDDDDGLLNSVGGALSALQLVDNDNDISYVGSVPMKPRGMRRRANNNRNRNSIQTSSSLPGAPMLSSSNYQSSNFTPPPMQLTENSESGLQGLTPDPAYGSLRDSHLEGKFLDGPASYRDRASGQLHPLKHNQQIRLDDSATSYQHQPSFTSRLIVPSKNGMGDWSRLTPGERILANTSPKPSNDKTPPTTSTLSSMMMQRGDHPSSTATTTASSTTSSTYHGGLLYSNHHDDNDMNNNNNNNAVLSTSLTGFEILKAASQHPELLNQTNNKSQSMPSYSVPPSFIMSQQPPDSLHPLSPQHHDDDDDDDDDGGGFFELDME